MFKKLFFGVAAVAVLFTATGAAHARGCRCNGSRSVAVAPAQTAPVVQVPAAPQGPAVAQTPGTTTRRSFSVQPSPQPTYRTYSAPRRSFGSQRPNNVLPDAGAKIRGEF